LWLTHNSDLFLYMLVMNPYGLPGSDSEAGVVYQQKPARQLDS